MRFTLLTLWLIGSLVASAKEKVRIGPAPSWLYKTKPDTGKRPDSRDISDGYYFILLDEQTNIAAQTEYTHSLKQIVNESGVQNASEVSVSFAPDFQELIFHQVAIIRDGQVINQLQMNRIKVVAEEANADEFEYTGLKRAFITLKDVRKGDRIEISYSIAGFNPVFAGRYSDKFHFTQGTAICNYFLTILNRPADSLYISYGKDAPHPDQSTVNGLHIFHWDNPALKTYESRSHVPAWYDAYPFVEVSSYPDWRAVADWGRGLMHNYHCPLPPGLEKKIAAWKKASGGDRDEFANLAIQFVQDEVRYLGLEIGPGTHQPRLPAEVFTHRFGDCKDKSLLLACILRTDSIPAFVALANTVRRSQLTRALPGHDDFNHAIVAIERSRDQFLFIDPTISAQRGALINRYVPAYGYALLLREGEEGLRPVEPGFLFKYTIEETLDAHYKDTSRYTIHTDYSGGAADDFRGDFAENSVKELEKNYLKYYGEVFEGIKPGNPVTTTDDSVKDEFVVDESYLIPKLWTVDDKGKRSFDFTARAIADYLTSPSDLTADAPMALRYPLNVDYTLHINMPEEWCFSDGPLHVKNDSYQFDFVPEVSGSYITLKYHFKTFKDHIPAGEIEQYKNDFKDISGRIGFSLYKNEDFAAASPDEPGRKTVSVSSPAQGSGGANWPAIWLSLAFLFGAYILFRRLDTTSAPILYEPGTGYQLEGWVIVLGITMAIRFLAYLRILFVSGYYDQPLWNLLAKQGSGMQFLFMAQLVILLFQLAGLAALLYWYGRRRDIFPKMFIWQGSIALLAKTLVWAPSGLGLFGSSILTPEANRELISAVIYPLVWSIYLMRSHRVKATFLMPYGR